MSDQDPRSPHLSDNVIELYWRDQLSDHEERRVEEHYLDCASCQRRVYEAETRSAHHAAAPSPPSMWWLWTAAAIGGIVLAGVAWQQQWFGSGSGTTTVAAPIAESALTVARLAPPLRNATAPEVRLTGEGVVLFVLDVREAGPGGSVLDVDLLNGEQQPVLRLRGVRSSAEGELRVPVEASVLIAGTYTFDVHSGALKVGLPFVVRREAALAGQGR
jgi:hypothetical protein